MDSDQHDDNNEMIGTLYSDCAAESKIMMPESAEIGQATTLGFQSGSSLVVSSSMSHYNIHQIDKNNSVMMVMNKSWCDRLLYLQLKAMQFQYYLACYNTIGGAYHLCDQPKKALLISQKQEILARHIGSIQLLLKAKAYQYTNIGLLGRPKRATKLLKQLINEADEKNLKDTGQFIEANLSWMQQRLLLTDIDSDHKVPS